MKHFIIFLLVIFCLLMSCNNGDGNKDNSGNNNEQNPERPGNNSPSLPSEAGVVPIATIYQVEVMNNTGATVEITPGIFSKSKKNGVLYMSLTSSPRTVVGNGTLDFSWFSRNRLGYANNDVIEVGQSERDVYNTVEEQMKNFDPGIMAFFLRIRMDDSEYYLVGWSQSLELPSLIESPPDNSGFIYTLDTGKIVQYGIGYGDNKEVRVKNHAKGDWVYAPNIISIDNDGETEVYDFDDATIVYGTAVLTIDGPDKIEFKTTRLWKDGEM